MLAGMKTPRPLSRRSFLSTCATAAVATGVPAWFAEREALAAEGAAAPHTDANSRPGIALIGCGGMGCGDARNATRFGDILAVCDVDQDHLDAAAKDFTTDGKVPARYTDFRKVMERDDIHVIVQGAPDHWHTLINLAAARAGKDVYAEKPLTLTIDEGRRLVAAVRERRVVLQTGTQQRSSERFRLACELVRNGRLGTLHTVRVFVPAGLRDGPFRPQPVPPRLDWNFWLGQAPWAEYLRERCHSSFRWWYDYAGGPVTDWGAHHNDIARWAIGLDGPTEIDVRALTEPIEGGYTVPSEFEATLTYANGVAQVIKTTLDDNPWGGVVNPDGQRNGIRFEGSDGWIWVNRDQITASDRDLLTTPLPSDAVRLEVSRDHMRNFFDCVGSRKDPICPVEVGHCSAVIGHLIVIAMRLGIRLRWDPAAERFVGEGAEAGNARLAREMRAPYDYSFVGG